MNDASYKRSQVEEAIWALQWLFRLPPGGPPAAPSVFRTRIKRLLDLDRSDDLPDYGDESGETYAFSEEKPGKQGRDVGFSAFDAFCLAIGLELLGGGYKQLDVVVLMRSMRKPLRDEFDELERIVQKHGPLPSRGSFWSHEQAPELPVATVERSSFADPRVFVIIRPVVLTEMFPVLMQKLAKRKIARLPPIFVEPQFVYGIGKLQTQLHEDMPLRYRTATVIEISLIAYAIPQQLRKTSAAKRGPK